MDVRRKLDKNTIFETAFGVGSFRSGPHDGPSTGQFVAPVPDTVDDYSIHSPSISTDHQGFSCCSYHIIRRVEMCIRYIQTLEWLHLLLYKAASLHQLFYLRRHHIIHLVEKTERRILLS